MAYQSNYINKSKQFNIINYTLALTDSQGLMPDIFLPVILEESEDTEENLNRIAQDMINQSTISINSITTDSITVDEVPIVDEVTTIEEPIQEIFN